jgi:hypothetical protein
MFQEVLQFQAHFMIYIYSKQTIMKVISWMPLPLTWHISYIIVDFFSYGHF